MIDSYLMSLVEFVGDHSSGNGVVAVLVCYLDDSDSIAHSVITLAGYIAEISTWRDYEAHAANVYQKYGIKLLHAKQFHHHKGEFKNWNPEKRLTFVNDLYGPLRRFVREPYHMGIIGISSSINKKEHKGRQREGVLRGQSPLASAFDSIAGKLSTKPPLSLIIRQEGLSFVVETGHKNNPQIEQNFHFHTQKGMFLHEIGKTITFAQKDSSHAIQLADFLAFHSRRWGHKVGPSLLGMEPDACSILNAMNSHVRHLFMNDSGSKLKWLPKDHVLSPFDDLIL